MTPEIPRLETLQDDQKAAIAVTQRMLTEQQRLAYDRQLEILRLEEQLACLKRQIFGKKSEKFIDPCPEQPVLPGFPAAEPAPQPETQVVAEHTRQKARVRKGEGDSFMEYPDDLPVEIIENDLPEDKKVDPETGEPLELLRIDTVDKLAMKQAEFRIKRYRNYIYTKRSPQGSTVVSAPMPDSPVPKSHADISLITAVMTMKYADHLPLYRIAEIFGRSDVRISRQTLSNWVGGVADALEPLYNLMFLRILADGNIHVDETPVKMQAKGKCVETFLWTYVGGAPPGDSDPPPYTVFEFCNDRKHHHVFDRLADYQGLLHSDCYGAYVKIGHAEKNGIIWIPCGAHIRRKFEEATAGDLGLRDYFLRRIGRLYRYERLCWRRSPERRLKIRNKYPRRILRELVERATQELHSGNHLPRLKLTEALAYFLKAAPYWSQYLDHAEARIDNNTAERAVKPVVIGRKNWLFFGSEDGGKNAAILFSIIQTCRNLKINPQEYLEDVLARMPSSPASSLADFLPDRWLAASSTSAIPQKMAGPYSKSLPV